MADMRDIAKKRSRDRFIVEVHGTAGLLTEPSRSALLAAVDECVLNSRHHAGTEHVDVLLSRSGSCVTVVISDSGQGFDLLELPPDSIGVKESVLARMRDVGGRASVFSVPGRGTTVLLEAATP
ncbi:sensor histidine kinase [bacterium RCC_150]